MGVYFNPDGSAFEESVNSEIYVDKSLLIKYMNELIATRDKYVCVSRPRRFGKSMAAEMLVAYYSSAADTGYLFDGLKISQEVSYRQHLNQHNVIQINMQSFLSENDSVDMMLYTLQKRLCAELEEEYSDRGIDFHGLSWSMEQIYAKTKQQFIVLIDEWDCIFREFKQEIESQKRYLDFLRNWLKDKRYISFAYMTGILPVKKYGTHSALNMFTEYSIIEPGKLAPYFGFTEEEVERLCERFHMNFDETKAWYDGYRLRISSRMPELLIYNPKSVVEAMKREDFGTYWNQTETYEALKIYMEMNFDGLKDAVAEMLAGGSVSVNTSKFSNDMTTVRSRDDVLTLLIHLGYLTYHAQNKTVSIPNKEIAQEYINVIEGERGWTSVIQAIENSKKLLQALWNMDCETVAEGIDKAHQEVSILQYNDENALSYTVSLAFYYAREYYTIIRELPTGKGYADLCFMPRKLYLDKPALLIELKWDQSVTAAIHQIKEKQYVESLKEYKGNLLLVGISYEKETKKHICAIERMKIE